MGKLLAWITGPIAGYVLGGALALALVGVAVTVGVYHYKLADMTEQRDGYRDRIENPSTGYVARNAQCETNVASLRAGLSRLSADVKALADDTRARDAWIATALAQASARAAGAKASADKLLALPARSAPGTLKACLDGASVLKRGVYQ